MWGSVRRTTEPNSKTPTHHFPLFLYSFYGQSKVPKAERVYLQARGAGMTINDDTSMGCILQPLLEVFLSAFLRTGHWHIWWGPFTSCRKLCT